MNTILHNIGHRGGFLILLGLAFISYGLGLQFLPFHGGVNLILTLHQWEWLWIFSGVFLIGRSWGNRDKVAYGVAAFVSAWWSARWFWLWLFHNALHAWAISALWAVITLMILLVSTWPEARCRLRRKERDRE